ncbi:MAG: glycosyltransferase family 39 protein [Planctomycetota bacterium]|nr:glycosyltransferase family 39 protein [Planctomycetota bacterium]
MSESVGMKSSARTEHGQGGGPDFWSRLVPWTDGVRGWIALVTICLTVYLPGLTSIAPIDRDESRFAQASRQMFESVALPPDQRDPAMHSGGLAVPMVQDRPRLNKPPLVYWLQAASAAVFTGGDPLKDHIWMYRVPGVLCAIASTLLTWRLGRRMFDRRAAFLGAVILGVCPLVVVDAHMARADQLLLTTVLAGQYWLWRLWRSRTDSVVTRQSRSNSDDSATPDSVPSSLPASRTSSLRLSVSPSLLWLILAISILAKGPIGPLVIGLTAIAFAAVHGRVGLRWLWSLRPITGVLIVLAVCVPWLWMVGEHVGWQKYYDTIFKETITRSLEPKEGHWGPPGYHLILMVALLWPGSMLTGVGVLRAVRIGWPRAIEKGQAASRWWKRRGGRDAELFCLAWTIPAWIVFELISTKLPHYTMPMYPALALLSGRAVMSAARLLKNDRLARFGATACVLAGPLVIAALFVASIVVVLQFTSDRASFAIGIAMCGTLLLLFAIPWHFAVRAARTGRWPRSQAFAIVGGTLLNMLGLGALGPLLMPGVNTDTLMLALNEPSVRIDWRTRPLASTYHEDSLIFSTRGHVERIDVEHIDSWFAEHPDGILIARPKHVSAGEDSGSFFYLAKYRRLNEVKIFGVWEFVIVERADYNAVPNPPSLPSPGASQ